MTEHIHQAPAGAKERSPQQIVAETEPHIRLQVLEMLVALLLTHGKGLREASKRGCAVSTAMLAIRSVLAQAKLAREKAAT